MKCDTRNVTHECDTLHVRLGGGSTFSPIFSSLALWFRRDSVLKIFSERMNQLGNESINHEGACKTAPAPPGLLPRTFHDR